MTLLKKITLNSLLILIGLVVALLLAEGILRFLKPPQAAYTRAPCIHQKDEEIGYRFEPNSSGRMYKNFEMDNWVEINAAGFHDIEHPTQTDDDVLRILALGDSFTAALEVNRKAGWTQVLQGQLQAIGYPSADVVNLGIDGASTDVQLALLKENLARYQPDIVILAFYRNDPPDLLNRRTFRECYKGYTLAYQDEATESYMKNFVDNARPPGPLFSALYEHSYLARLIIFIIGEDIFWRNNLLSPVKNYYAPSMLGLAVEQKAENPPQMEALIAEFSQLADENDFRFIVAPVPANDNWYNPGDSMAALQGAISPQLWASLDIVDVMPIMERRLTERGKVYKDLFWRYDEHYNALGYELYGLALAELVDQYLQNSPLELYVTPETPGLWSAVQWQDNAGDWHTVEAWQGTLNEGSKIYWWVSAKDFGAGPFRWLVAEGPQTEPLAVSEPFFLPGAGESLRIEVNLEIGD